MYILTITNDLYGYISEQCEANGIVSEYRNIEEAFKMAKHFIKQGFDVAIQEKNIEIE